jgi:hypothetical protein
MTSDRLQVYLAEYSALRQELLETVKWRDRLVFLSLGVSGALFSFVFTSGNSSHALLSSRTALYLIAPLAAEIGGLYIVIQRRIYQMGIYFRTKLAPNVDGLLTESDAPAVPTFEAFIWEFADRRAELKWWRILIEWFLLVSAFSLSGVLAQFVIYLPRTGAAPPEGLLLKIWWWANWFFVALSLFLMWRRLKFAWKKGKSKA